MLNYSKQDLRIPQMVKRFYRLIWRQEKEEKIHNYPTPERLWDMVHGNITDWETRV